MNTQNFDINVKIQREIGQNWRNEHMNTDKKIDNYIDRTIQQLTFDSCLISVLDTELREKRITATARSCKHNNYGYNRETY